MSSVPDAQFVAGRDILNRSEHGQLQSFIEHRHHVGRFILGWLIHLSPQTAQQGNATDRPSKNKQQPIAKRNNNTLVPFLR